MHILVMPSFYPSATRPVVGSFFQDQVEALRRGGYQVEVLVMPRLREMFDYARRHHRFPTLVEEPDQVYRMHWGGCVRIFPRLCAWLHRSAGLRAFERYLKKHSLPDLIHAHNFFYGGYLAAQIKQRYNLPVVLTEHSSNFLRGRIFLPGQHRIVRQTAQQVDQVLAVGKALADHLNDRYQANAHIIPNLINTNFFTFKYPPEKPFTFAVAARLFKIKNIPLLLDAFAKAFKGDEVYLKIAGDGPDRDRLERQTQQLELEQQVKFLGRLSREKVLELYHQSHAVASSSWLETFGVTMIEALSCGRPVVATRSGGPEGFVTPQTGIIVEQNVDSLAEGMRRLRHNYDHYNPTAIRTYCVDRFSEKAVVQQLTQVYERTKQELPADSGGRAT